MEVGNLGVQVRLPTLLTVQVIRHKIPNQANLTDRASRLGTKRGYICRL